MYIGTDFYVHRNADVYVQFTNYVLQVHHLPSALQINGRNRMPQLHRLRESHRHLCTLHRCSKEKVRYQLVISQAI
jgi:hypothetical protein